MGDIFISYDPQDQAYVDLLHKALLEHDFSCWVDSRPEDIQWQRETETRVRACRAFIVVMTPSAEKSYWVQTQLTLAIKLDKPIFPLLLAGDPWWNVGLMKPQDVRGSKLPDTPFYIRLTKVLSKNQTDHKTDDKTSGRSIIINGPVKNSTFITGDENKVGDRHKHPKQDEPSKQPPPPIHPTDKAPAKKTTSQARSSKIVITLAIIGLFCILCVGSLAAMIPWNNFLNQKASPTRTSSFQPALTETIQPDIPTVNHPTLTAAPESANTPNTPTPLPLEFTDEKDIPMVLVSGGIFKMGSDNRGDNAEPIHDVDLPSFYMDKYEVTNEQYKACETAQKCPRPTRSSSATRSSYYENPAYKNHPVLYVNWYMAKTYCEWREARLPTESEWEKAARGTDQRIYPWGQGILSDYANYNHGDNGDTTAVGSYAKDKSPSGIYDMAGNVGEWVADWFDVYPGGNRSRNSDFGQQYRVIRGGAWNSISNNVRVTFRDKATPTISFPTLGFRCARSIP